MASSVLSRERVRRAVREGRAHLEAGLAWVRASRERLANAERARATALEAL